MSRHDHNTTPSDEATVDEALRLMKPTVHVTEEVKASLAGQLPGISDSVTAIAHMGPLRLAVALIGTQGVAEDDLTDIARDLIAAFGKMLGEAAAPARQSPLNVTVTTEKKLGEMTAAELLGRLVGDPSQFDEIAEALRNTRLVRLAGRHPWVLPAADGSLDTAATLDYLGYLSRPGSVPQRLWPPRGGTRPATLESVFGGESLLMVNPFTGQAFSGFDEWGNDWNALPEAVHLAMLWAVTTGHRNLPAVPDARRLTDDLFARKRPAYLREIAEDFEEARRRDPQLAAMTRYFSGETAAGPLAPAPAISRRTEDDYRRILSGAAQGRRDVMSGSIRLGPVVIDSFSTMSGSIHLEGTVVLGSSSTMSGSLNGTAYVPRGVRISTMSGSDHLALYVRSYEDLCRQAGVA
jgi:hypothetical protein